MGVDDTKNVGLLVGFSLILTILGLVFSFSTTAVIVLKLLVKHSKYVRQITEIGTKMTLHCDSFSSKHSCTHLILQESIVHALRTCQHSNLWIDRSDIQLSIEVFYIANRIGFNKEIDIYFQTGLTCYKDTEYDIPKILANEIRQFGSRGSTMQKALTTSFKTRMKLKKGRVKVSQLNVIYEGTSAQDGDQLVLANSNNHNKSTSTGGSTTSRSNLTSVPVMHNMPQLQAAVHSNSSVNGDIEVAMELARYDAKFGVTPTLGTGAGSSGNGNDTSKAGELAVDEGMRPSMAEGHQHTLLGDTAGSGRLNDDSEEDDTENLQYVTSRGGYVE